MTDASRVWYLRVVEELNNLGAKTSRYDKAFFMWKYQGNLEGLIVVHVDDFLWTGSEVFLERVITPLKAVFKISKEFDSFFRYIGINVSHSNGVIKLDQLAYISKALASSQA